jgi:hypothetical protein
MAANRTGIHFWMNNWLTRFELSGYDALPLALMVEENKLDFEASNG